MRNIFLVATFIFFSCSIAMAQIRPTSGGEVKYSHWVQGLKKYCHKSSTQVLAHGWIPATVVDMSRPNADCIEFKVVNAEGNLSRIRLLGKENDMTLAIYLHELKPDFGKYCLWDSVILAPREDFGYFFVKDIRIIGRFKTVLSKSGVKIKGYQVERYDE